VTAAAVHGSVAARLRGPSSMCLNFILSKCNFARTVPLLAPDPGDALPNPIESQTLP